MGARGGLGARAPCAHLARPIWRIRRPVKRHRASILERACRARASCRRLLLLLPLLPLLLLLQPLLLDVPLLQPHLLKVAVGVRVMTSTPPHRFLHSAPSTLTLAGLPPYA